MPETLVGTKNRKASIIEVPQKQSSIKNVCNLISLNDLKSITVFHKFYFKLMNFVIKKFEFGFPLIIINDIITRLFRSRE